MSAEDVQNATTHYQGISMSGKLTVANDVSLNSKLSVASDVSFNSKLFVQGKTVNNNDVSMNTNLVVGGNVTINKKLFVNEIYADNFIANSVRIRVRGKSLVKCHVLRSRSANSLSSVTAL